MNGSPVCVDASFVMRLLLSEEVAVRAESLVRQWCEADRPLVAPSLLRYEVSNALFRYVAHGEISLEQALSLFDASAGLGIRLFEDEELHRRAMQLAHSLSLDASYDAHYLALAERLGAVLWTADRRLAKVRGEGLPRVEVL